MKPLVVYIYDRPGGYQAEMEKGLDRKGVERLPVEIPVFTWRNRILKTIEIAGEYPDRLLFFIDAWDTLMLGEKWELEKLGWERGITFAAQKRCWPDPLDMAYNIWWESKVSTRWRYLNSNPMAGRGSDIYRALDWGWQRFPLPGGASTTTDPSGDVCERFYTQLLLRAPKEWGLTIDTNCSLCQVTSEAADGELELWQTRIRNAVTGTHPIFFHLNAKFQFDVSLLSE